MKSLPDDAVVVRGGLNRSADFAQGTGVTQDQEGKLHGVSVNAATGLGEKELTAANPVTGYAGIRNNQVGRTTVGKIRALGGEVVPAPSRKNPHHATVEGLTAEQASELFSPTIANPSRKNR